MAYVVRSPRANRRRFMSELQQAVWSVELEPAGGERPDARSRFARSSMAQTSFALTMLGIAAGVALLLGIVGIYGVIAYIAAQRTREIGIRMALGAQAADVQPAVRRHGLWLIGVGVALGVLAAIGVDAADVVAAVRRQPDGSDHLRGGVGRARRGGADGDLAAGPARLRASIRSSRSARTSEGYNPRAWPTTSITASFNTPRTARGRCRRGRG